MDASPRSGPAPGVRRPVPVTPLWLAHHYPEDYDRCVPIGRRHVCRRCLVLYPVTFAVLAVTLGRALPPLADVALVVGFPLPAVVDFLAEHRALVGPSRRRLVALTVPLGVGLGRGLARYLDDHADPLFWATVAGYGLPCVAVALWFRRAAPAAEPRSGRPPAARPEGDRS